MTAIFYDLSSLALILSKRGARYKSLVGKIQRYVAIWSAYFDLRSVAVSLETLMRDYVVPPLDEEKEFPEEHMEIANALFCKSVIFYARATDTQSNSRKSFGLRDKLSQSNKETHKRIMKLRNDALAHFGAGGEFWSDARAVFCRVDGKQDITVAYHTSHYRGPLTKDFAALVAEAIEIAYQAGVAAGDAVSQALGDASDNDRGVLSLLQTLPFVPEDFYPSKSGVRSLMRSLAERTTTLGPARWPSRQDPNNAENCTDDE